MAEKWNQDEAFWNDTMQREGAKSDPRLNWFREAKFGLFIHWGLYAIPAGRWKGKFVEGIGEWIQFNARIPVKEYSELTLENGCRWRKMRGKNILL